PDWSKTEASTNGDGADKPPEWAQTVPTDPGESIPEAVTSEPPGADAAGVEETEPPEAQLQADEPMVTEPPEVEAEATEPPAVEAEAAEPQAVEAEAAEPTAVEAETAEPPGVEAEVTVALITEPPKAVAADALKSTWPPASGSAPAPPVETDIWPPEPPTEHAMPAWPPPSELDEPDIPAQAIPSWPDSFDATPPAAAAQAPTVPAAPAVKPRAGGTTPPTLSPVPPRAEPMPAPTKTPAPPVAGGQLPVAKLPPAPAKPAQPAQPGGAQSSWQVVEQPRKSGPHGNVESGPTAEDRSYAEWFAWAKRGGAPASACHAAA